MFVAALLTSVAASAGFVFFPVHREAMSKVEERHVTGTCDACREDFLVESLVSISDEAPLYVCEGCLQEIAMLLAVKEKESETGFAVPFSLTPFVVPVETMPAWLRDPRFTTTCL